MDFLPITPKKALVSLGGVVAAVTAASLAFLNVTASAGPSNDVYAAPSAAQVAASEEFALYDAGPSVGPHQLVARTRQLNPRYRGEPHGVNVYNFIYGTCEAGPDSGCVPPLAIQIWPGCQRSYADIDSLARRTTRKVRGVPAAEFRIAGEYRLEVYTGRVTVVIYGSKSLAEQAATQLQAANGLAGSVSPPTDLPKPAAGATSGNLSCLENELGSLASALIS